MIRAFLFFVGEACEGPRQTGAALGVKKRASFISPFDVGGGRECFMVDAALCCICGDTANCGWVGPTLRDTPVYILLFFLA